MAQGKYWAGLSLPKSIVADIRLRIETGELRPGDRIPSTREISRQWGVAHATAAKVLTMLREEGLVEAIPSSRTVVAAEASGHPVQGNARDRIVKAAIEIADADGLTGMSMRAVAARLDGATMSIYHHVRSREVLIRLMADAAFGEALPIEQSHGWRGKLESVATTLWTVYKGHPWLARLGLSSPSQAALPNLVVYVECAHRILVDQGLDSMAALRQCVLLHSFVHGVAANLLGEVSAAGGGVRCSDAPVPESATCGDLGERGLRNHGFRIDLEELFKLGLRQLLDGVERSIGNPS
ncbi:GntR family transcriptional regulator [Amycolatopsis lurida]|uniref:GntR family transcriptional regulator n=1 Tax=Amycolatopsis lurida NRRL 2430 TaxID=1460371 RepID=A0A2P2FGG3_AMYLU|nr:GntR family transcriptional regulator [Amycolatopsis lurida]KFU75805.1 hypothetical protein BB31_39595 [Amycolatopsis lurida NRRL 2430]